jgi:hypothetical protein
MRDQRAEVEVGSGPTGDQRVTFPVFTLPARQRRPSGAEKAQLDAVTDLTLTPLTELTRATSGALVGGVTRLAADLVRLVGRRRIAFSSPPPTEPADLHSVEVRWRGGDGRPLPALHWRRTTTPPEVTAARLRALLAGDPPPAGAIDARLEPGAGAGTGSQLRFCLPTSAATTWSRVSIARQAGSEPATLELGRPEVLRAADGRACRTVELPAITAGERLAIAVEDLEGETWAGLLVPAAPSTSS